MNQTSTYYRRNLPHYLPDGYAYFITTRLKGTLPKNTVDKIKELHLKELEKIESINNLKLKSLTYKNIQ